MQRKLDKLGFIKIENFCASKGARKNMKNDPENGRIFLQNIDLIKEQCPEYVRKSYNSIIKTQLTQFENGQRI